MPARETGCLLPAMEITPSTPDIFEAEPFHREQLGRHLAVAFRDIQPMAVRGGGQAIISYPLVVAIFDPQAKSLVFMVTVEIGTMFGTCCLCGFAPDGLHLNFGNLDPNAGEEEFLDQALSIARDWSVGQADEQFDDEEEDSPVKPTLFERFKRLLRRT